MLSWQGLRWYGDKRVYIGTRPGGKVETVIPDIVHDAEACETVRRLLRHWGLAVSVERISDERARASVGRQRAEGGSLEQALCRAAWLAIEAEEDG